MGQVTVPDLDDEVIQFHRRRAEDRGVSLEDELREVLTQAAREARQDLVRRLDAIRAMTPRPPPGQRWPTAEELIREDRDSR